MAATRAADEESDADPENPLQRAAVAVLPVAAHAGEAGRWHLRDQGSALRDVLLRTEQQHAEDNEAATRARAHEARCQPADETDAGAGEEVRNGGHRSRPRSPPDVRPGGAKSVDHAADGRYAGFHVKILAPAFLQHKALEDRDQRARDRVGA